MKPITVLNDYVVLKKLIIRNEKSNILCLSKDKENCVGKVKYFQYKNKYGIGKGDIVFYDKFSSSNVIILGKKYSCLKMSKIICKY
ncbi:hypothetical protein JSR06_00540 [Candidatus Vidania fulgoroideae]|uniref:Uncharacterized protein n=1 Tax=Candidatus Vidania fulgoroideorum TaxID=881286 RepID=A0A974XE21_9PROT|nr:hypothetical protein JSR06_00540 [Candidatus Vidania fulgoroideae]